MSGITHIKEAAIVLGMSLTFLIIVLLVVAFLMITLITLVFGFWGISATAAGIAEIMIAVSILLILISAIFFRRRR
jgi:uncharacterized membrane protein YtjA (UPF0391 family)